MKEKLMEYQKQTGSLKTRELIDWTLDTFGPPHVILASSLSNEDQVLTHMLLLKERKARILTLDTGRVFQETYDTMQETMEKYGFCYEVLFPESRDVEELERKNGPNLFYKNLKLRKLCCEVRKIRPLKRALSTVDAWICGLRRGQSMTRAEVLPLEWDEQFNIIKINPLSDWLSRDVWNYIKENQIPYNKLFDKGFASIGCLPCTRATGEGDDERSGRWWWESPEKKECGLHVGKS